MLFPQSVLRGHRGEVQCACFVPGRDHLMTGDSEGSVHVWDLATARSAAHAAHGANAGVTQVQAIDASAFVSQGRDGMVQMWQLREDGTMAADRSIANASFHFCRCQVHKALDSASLPSPCLVTYNSEASRAQLWDFDSKAAHTAVPYNKDHGMCMCLQLHTALAPVLFSGCVLAT